MPNHGRIPLWQSVNLLFVKSQLCMLLLARICLVTIYSNLPQLNVNEWALTHVHIKILLLFSGPTNPVVYPNLTYPLLLFPQKSFVGTPVKVPPDSYHVFARNHENSQTFTHLSARILFTRSITFSRNREDDQKYVVSPGSDISDMESYFGSNPDIGKPLWFNYAATVEAEFYIKVEGSPHCTNCSETGGSCYTGKCVCLPGYNGTHCTTTP